MRAACHVLMHCCNRQQVVHNHQARVGQVQVSGKLQHYRTTFPPGTLWSCAMCTLAPARL